MVSATQAAPSSGTSTLATFGAEHPCEPLTPVAGVGMSRLSGQLSWTESVLAWYRGPFRVGLGASSAPAEELAPRSPQQESP